MGPIKALWAYPENYVTEPHTTLLLYIDFLMVSYYTYFLMVSYYTYFPMVSYPPLNHLSAQY